MRRWSATVVAVSFLVGLRPLKENTLAQGHLARGGVACSVATLPRQANPASSWRHNASAR